MLEGSDMPGESWLIRGDEERDKGHERPQEGCDKKQRDARAWIQVDRLWHQKRSGKVCALASGGRADQWRRRLNLGVAGNTRIGGTPLVDRLFPSC